MHRVLIAVSCLYLCGVLSPAQLLSKSQPNVVIIFLDDAGYSDFHPFGKPSYPTPNVEKLATEGVRFERFHVPQAICSSSRAALLSGCFPGRTRVVGAHGPGGPGLDRKFATMAEMLKNHGYVTAHFGKWHIGDREGLRSHDRGFDESAGIMYSNDMWKFHPLRGKKYRGKPLSYWENGEVTIKDMGKEEQKLLTKWFTDKSTRFIEKNKHHPFFLYLAHPMPHVPLFCSDQFKGKSGVGLYGDVIMEIDWSVGKVMGTLKEAGLENDTIVIFTSDNGPWTEYGNHGGKTPFRSHKATSFDGGTRSPMVISFPSKLKGGRSIGVPISSVDLFPTLAHLTGAPLPENPIDGKNIWSTLQGETLPPHDYLPFSISMTLQGVYSGDGRWKLHLPHTYREVARPGKDGMPGEMVIKKMELSLFNLMDDPLEKNNVVKKYPEVVQKLQEYAKNHQKNFKMN